MCALAFRNYAVIFCVIVVHFQLYEPLAHVPDTVREVQIRSGYGKAGFRLRRKVPPESVGRNTVIVSPSKRTRRRHCEHLIHPAEKVAIVRPETPDPICTNYKRFQKGLEELWLCVIKFLVQFDNAFTSNLDQKIESLLMQMSSKRRTEKTTKRKDMSKENLKQKGKVTLTAIAKNFTTTFKKLAQKMSRPPDFSKKKRCDPQAEGCQQNLQDMKMRFCDSEDNSEDCSNYEDGEDDPAAAVVDNEEVAETTRNCLDLA